MAGQTINRFQFLRGDFSGERAAIRPPWSLHESKFIDHCTRCSACVNTCPEYILVKGRGGFPQVDFTRGECTFCRRCVEACEPAALQAALPEPWRLRAEIADNCLAFQGVVCRTCAEQCEAGAIRFRPVIGGGAVPILSDDLCTGCGACVAPCPAKAMRMVVPAEMEESVA